MRIQYRNLTSQARRIVSNKILPASDHRWVFSFPSLFSLSTPRYSQIMEPGRRGQDPDAGGRASEQPAHLHPQHVQRHCGEVDDDDVSDRCMMILMMIVIITLSCDDDV